MADIAKIPEVDKTLADVKADLSAATDAILKAADAVLAGVETEVPALTDDVKNAVIAVLDAEVGASSPVATILNGALGFAGPTLAKGEAVLNAAVVYGLQYLKTKLEAVKV